MALRFQTPEQTIAPAADLITLDEARRHIRRDDDDDDSLIEMLISVVMSHLDGVDGVLSAALINQTWEIKVDNFPSGDDFVLPLSPLRSISSITYYDNDNIQQTFSASNYSAQNSLKMGYIKLDKESAWPSTYDRDDAVTITGVFGYGAAATSVPAAIKHAALLLLGHWYENREAAIVGTIVSDLPMGVMRLLRPYIRPHF